MNAEATRGLDTMADAATWAIGLSIGATNLAAVTGDRALTRKPVLTLFRQRPRSRCAIGEPRAS